MTIIHWKDFALPLFPNMSQDTLTMTKVRGHDQMPLSLIALAGRAGAHGQFCQQAFL